MKTIPSPEGGCVLVVDDDERNRILLSDVLAARGYRVLTAENGEEALRLVNEEAPDAVLLDIMMPGIDGIEVCRRIRRNEEAAMLPIIMVTALSEREPRVRSIAAGADDFLTKPIDPAEVALRVRNAVHRKHLMDALRKSLEEQRHLERLRDDLVHMLVHDLRSPLVGMLAFLDLLESGELDEATRRDVGAIKTAARNLTEMISSILDVSRLEAGRMPLHREPCNPADLVEAALQRLGRRAASPAVKVDVAAQAGGVECDRQLVERVIINLLANAVKYTPKDKSVLVRVRPAADGLRFEVEDAGPGVPPEMRERIFDKFGQVETRREGRARYSTGLGLTFCKLAVEAHDGKIGVDSAVGRGSTFWFVLPATGRNAP
ncbi:MAG: response regulator [Kiritimatiellaeota bacterium]|nr:response regulator [Kiritimatiellota bacterium]